MRLHLINPNSSRDLTTAIEDTARRVVSEGTLVTATNPAAGPAVIEGSYDEALATFHLLGELKRVESKEAPDAYIVACFGDPGLNAMKELTDRPVIGIAEAAIQMSAFVGATFSIVSTLPRVRSHLFDLVRRVGAEHRLASLKTPNLGVLSFHEEGDQAWQVLGEAAAASVFEDGAEAVILGCAGMTGLASSLSDQLRVPVIDPVEAACGIAEGLVRLGYRTSKANTYQAPTEKLYR